MCGLRFLMILLVFRNNDKVVGLIRLMGWGKCHVNRLLSALYQLWARDVEGWARCMEVARPHLSCVSCHTPSEVGTSCAFFFWLSSYCPEGIMGQIVRHWYKPNEQGFTLINTISCN